uniref:glucan endo-1,3-beta-D-glucosidase n=1 Tax=Oryza meridionalis TaxID=40149 RepID=A0A0E0DZ19_9ORYZ
MCCLRQMYRGSCRARAWSESACGMFLLGWVQWPSWERTPVLHCSGWTNRNNQKGEKDVKALMGASPIVAYRASARVLACSSSSLSAGALSLPSTPPRTGYQAAERSSGARTPMAHVAFVALLFSLLVGHCLGGKVGICYGRNADDLPAPDKVVQLIQQQSLKYVRIYDTNIDVIKAFANTGVELMVGVPNSDLLPFAQYQSNVDTWLKNSILPYYPATMITYITVGAEVTESPVNVSALVVPAMRNVHTALKKAGLHKKITISSTHSLGILSRSFPPSAGAFNSSYAYFLKPMLEFLVENQAPFMVDLYPYYAYQNSPSNVSLNYALFSPQSQDVIDPNTGLVYTNMFDAQIDSIFFALMALNFKTLKIMVTETGWPNKGAAKETGATPDNAQTYNTNLIRHVVNDSGTPAKPGEEIDVYIFSLFNENRKPGIESERNWGLFFPDQSSIYSLDWTGRGNVDIMTGGNITNANGTWCVASANASETDLQNGLNWACGPGNVDCSAIQPSQPCYQPDTLASHASYAFNSYYQQNGANDVACDFGGTGVRTTKDPSYDTCVYMAAGSKMSTTNSSNLPVQSGFSPSRFDKNFCLLFSMLPIMIAACIV